MRSSILVLGVYFGTRADANKYVLAALDIDSNPKLTPELKLDAKRAVAKVLHGCPSF